MKNLIDFIECKLYSWRMSTRMDPYSDRNHSSLYEIIEEILEVAKKMDESSSKGCGCSVRNYKQENMFRTRIFEQYQKIKELEKEKEELKSSMEICGCLIKLGKNKKECNNRYCCNNKYQLINKDPCQYCRQYGKNNQDIVSVDQHIDCLYYQNKNLKEEIDEIKRYLVWKEKLPFDDQNYYFHSSRCKNIITGWIKEMEKLRGND
jgi:hypothetical protein